MTNKRPNCSTHHGEVRVRVMCPSCGNGGAHLLSMPQPKCHICNFKVLMAPANNNEIVCTWAYAKANEENWRNK